MMTISLMTGHFHNGNHHHYHDNDPNDDDDNDDDKNDVGVYDEAHLARDPIVGVPGGNPARPAEYITTLIMINHNYPDIWS